MYTNDQISKVLNSVIAKIESEDYTGGVELLNGLISENSSAIDSRMITEYKMIEQLMEYKKEMKDWEYYKYTRQIYEYCENKYAKNIPEIDVDEYLPDKDVIWCCWLQGLKQAPLIVQLCIESLKRFGKEVRILTAENISEYVEIPDYIMRKWKEGAMTDTHFSDILRIELLAERGGLWIDATVFCSDSGAIINILDGIDLFAYSFAMRMDLTKNILFDSWFLYSSKRNTIITETRDMLREYWMNEDSLKHYYLFHLCFSGCCRRHPNEWEKIPVFSMEPCHILQQEMLGDYNEKRWKQLMGMSGIHKLTYKYDQRLSIQGTMLEHLLRYGLEN